MPCVQGSGGTQHSCQEHTAQQWQPVVLPQPRGLKPLSLGAQQGRSAAGWVSSLPWLLWPTIVSCSRYGLTCACASYEEGRACKSCSRHSSQASPARADLGLTHFIMCRVPQGEMRGSCRAAELALPWQPHQTPNGKDRRHQAHCHPRSLPPSRRWAICSQAS